MYTGSNARAWLHPIPPPELREDNPCRRAPAWPGDPAVGTAVGTAAGVPSCRRAGCGGHRPRYRAAAPASPGQLPELSGSRRAHLSAQPVSGSQPRSGEDREERCLATVQPCGGWHTCPHVPVVRARSQPGARQPFPALEQGLALWRGKGHRSHWKGARRMSRGMVPSSGWDRGVKRAPLFLESCVDTAREGRPRTLELLQQQERSTHPDSPVHHLLPVIH